MVIVWRLRGNIIRTALCWIVWHNVHSQQHTYMSSSYRSDGLGLSHWDPYAVCRGGCLELYYCNMVDWFWWDSSLILTTNWFPSVLWHCWFGHLTCKNHPWNDLLCVEWDVKPYTLTPVGSRTEPCGTRAGTPSCAIPEITGWVLQQKCTLLLKICRAKGTPVPLQPKISRGIPPTTRSTPTPMHVCRFVDW